MAALLCKFIFVEPCKMLGKGCDGLMKACDKSCKCVSDLIKPITEALCDCSRPFTFLTFCAACLLGVPAIMGILGLVSSDTGAEQCAKSGIVTKLGVEMIVFVGNLVFVFYVHSKFPEAEPYKEVWKRFHEMFMNDVWFAVYFIFWIFSVVWTSMLAKASAQAKSDGCEDIAPTLISNADLATMIAYIALFLGPIFTFCTLCAVRVKEPKGRPGARPGQNTAGQNTAGPETAGQNTAGQNPAGGQAQGGAKQGSIKKPWQRQPMV